MPAQQRLFDCVGDDLHGLELVRTVAAPKVTHLKLARRSEGEEVIPVQAADQPGTTSGDLEVSTDPP